MAEQTGTYEDLPPGLARDIAKEAVAYLRKGCGSGALENAFGEYSVAWANWRQKKEREPVIALLKSEAGFRIELADALDWVVPTSDLPALVQRAIEKANNQDFAARLADALQPAFNWKEWNSGHDPLELCRFIADALGRLLGKEFDWKAWIDQPDPAPLYQFLQGREGARIVLAKALEFDPGPARAQVLAEKLIGGPSTGEDAIARVFTAHTPNWNDFRNQDYKAAAGRLFCLAVQNDFRFRQAVAKATQFRSAEADLLATHAVEMLRNARRRVRKGLIDAICAALPAEQGALKERLAEFKTARSSADSWTLLQCELRSEFSAQPELPGMVWDATGPKDPGISGNPSWPRPFPLVLREEIKQIDARRELGGVVEFEALPPLAGAVDAYDLAGNQQLTGLAFSGGGIRSATFNLGVLQALAELNFLQRFDYLSTVSGGGYIGAWLAGWGKQKGFENVRAFLSPRVSPDPAAGDVKPIRFLRQFSNYLTPELGLFSFDTWTMAAVYTRNLLLNQATLIAAIGLLLMVPRLVIFPLLSVCRCGVSEGTLMWLSLLLLFFSVSSMAWHLKSATAKGCGYPASDDAGEEKRPPRARFGRTLEGSDVVQLTCVFPVMLSVICGSTWFWMNIHTGIDEFIQDWRWFWLGSFGVFAVLSFILSAAGGVQKCFQKRLRYAGAFYAWLLMIFAALVTGAAATLLLRGYLAIMHAFYLVESAGGLWHAAVLGPVLLFSVLTLAAIVHVGLVGTDFPDSGREWLSRFRAVTSVYAFFGLALFAASIYGPIVIAWLGMKAAAGIGIGWVATTIASLLAGKSSQTGKNKDAIPSFNALDMLAKFGPPVFLVGFLLVISEAEHLLLTHGLLHGAYSFNNLFREHWVILAGVPLLPGSDWWIAGLLPFTGVLAFMGAVLIWRVDVNEFSMHHFYKNRLVRCYLGASNPRRNPDTFTGFDDNDDVLLAKLIPSEKYAGPYPILNSTLNLSAGGQLAWQERKAASFIFTPCFSGYDLTWDSDHPGPRPAHNNLKFCAYRKTEEYGGSRKGVHIGTAAAISGAAADPNQGYNTSTTVAFLMTVFDVRLGWWLGNPRRDLESQLASPRFGLVALISELLGRTDDRTNFINLSDGGHFDNMGIYELIRRRCKFIVLCDAEQDGSYRFGGLGMVIRRCRVDFGAEIQIDPSRIARTDSAAWSQDHCAVGSITYVDGTQGVLVYIKASTTGDEPEDVLEYAAHDPAFPHDSTANQWFGESQFESYRKLGYHATKSSLEPGVKWGDWSHDHTLTSLFEGLRQYWYPRNKALRENASKHTQTLNDLVERVRTCKSLHVLGTQLFPDSGLVPTAPAGKDDEFYFSLALIQLMEDIYFDFRLDEDGAQDDPRIGGWMTLFRTWARVPSVAYTWEAAKSTFQKGFQAFWKTVAS
jgi:hypothetical protein